MEHVGTILEREGDALELLLFKLIETRLLLEAGEARFLPRATREVERARTRARELDLLRAATVAQTSNGATLRDLAAAATGPWPAILRDHHDVLSRLVEEIEVVAHQNARTAREGLEQLSRQPVGAGAAGPGPTGGRPIRNAELDHLAKGAALDAVLGTAARLRMPDLLDFLR
ncbi:flagellar export chaperone FlgN [Aquihabitans sp. McL0605]|uniref:flagellar export chaperone FlgN n=1 Tax=Aquihabitans sp. McL0605 TaxID=3415671 RepID=UPI003CE6AA6B